MSDTRMRGVSVAVDEIAAAETVLAGLGLAKAAEAQGDRAIWIAGRHFIELRGRATAAAGSPARAINISGADFDLEAIAFRQWSDAEPLPRSVGKGSISGIDHVITMVGSVEAGSRTLRDQNAVTNAEALREFPALSTQAQMFLIGDGYVELNEPMGSGTPVWGTAKGIVGLVLQTDDIEAFRGSHPGASVSRASEVRANRPGQELESLGLVCLVKTRAFGDFQLYLFEPRLR